jgi:hypothetical protein
MHRDCRNAANPVFTTYLHPWKATDCSRARAELRSIAQAELEARLDSEHGRG